MGQDERREGFGWGYCHSPGKSSQNQVGAERTEHKGMWARDMKNWLVLGVEWIWGDNEEGEWSPSDS